MPQWIDTPAGPQYVDEYGNPAVPPDPVLQADVNAAAAVPDFVPPVPSRQMAAAAPEPVAAVPEVQPAQLPIAPGVSRGESISQSQSQFSLPSFNAVDSTIGGVRQQQNVAFQNAEAGRRSESQFTAAMGADQARAAVGLGNAEAEMQAARGDMYSQQAQLQSQMASAEVAAANDAALQTSGYRARFEQQLAAASAMRVDPRLTFSTGDGIGAAALLFTQGFLGSQGVPVFDAQGMINRLVDRKVDGDLLAIQQGHRLAEGTKQLWDMARFEAADEADARSRYRALTMAQAASEMEATTSQFGSKVAAAKGQAAAADIRVQINKDLAAITDRYFSRYMQQSKLALDEWQTKVQASNASQHLGLAKREMALKEKQAGAKTAGAIEALVDTTESGGGRPIAKFRSWVPEKIKGEVATKAAATSALMDRIREYQQIAKDVEIYGGWGKAMLNPAYSQRIINFRNGLGEDMIKATTGAVAPEAQMQRILGQIPLNVLTQRDGGKVIQLAMNDLQANVIDKVRRDIQQFTEPLTAEEAAAAGMGTPLETWGGAEGAEADILRNDRGEVKTAVQTAKEQLQEPHVGDAGNRVPVTELWSKVGNPVVKSGVKGWKDEIPGWAPAMETVFKIAVTPRSTWQGGDTSQPSEDAVEAYRTLNDLKVNAKDPAQRDYASDLLELIGDSVPEGVRPFSISDLIEE